MHPIGLAEEELRGEIRGFVIQHFRDGLAEGLGVDTPLVSSGLVDSVGVVELVEFLERRFGVRIADHEVGIASFDSVRALAALVRRKLVA